MASETSIHSDTSRQCAKNRQFHQPGIGPYIVASVASPELAADWEFAYSTDAKAPCSSRPLPATRSTLLGRGACGGFDLALGQRRLPEHKDGGIGAQEILDGSARLCLRLHEAGIVPVHALNALEYLIEFRK